MPSSFITLSIHLCITMTSSRVLYDSLSFCLIALLLILCHRSLVKCSTTDFVKLSTRIQEYDSFQESLLQSTVNSRREVLCSPECLSQQVCVQNKCLSLKDHGESCTHDRQCSFRDSNSSCVTVEDKKKCCCSSGFRFFPSPFLCQELDFCLENSDCFLTCVCRNNKCSLQTSDDTGGGSTPTDKTMNWPFIVSPLLGILFLIIIFVPVVVKRRRRRVRYSVLGHHEEEHDRQHSNVSTTACNQDYCDIDNSPETPNEEGTSGNVLSSNP